MSYVEGKVKWVLRVEGLAILLLSTCMYHFQNYGWETFFIYFLVPDISFLGYLISDRIGAIAYNCAHSLIGPSLFLSLSLFVDNSISQLIGLIWVAHIGFDRALGYGLKYSKGFGYTHLGKIGKVKNA
ncbi:DUF4260 domain-containing protein [Microbulbifer hainanensis]|uniref:DUF4260 domain-containing protein n=1 Tax=Microbulbifer hainanensis TaxID=2735675 RepID=UPI00186855FA|nr:DUF4260 domain-containing protein [Microbulbifer hainanensis]